MADAPPPDQAPTLVYRGGRTLAGLKFQNVYYGAAWREDQARPDDAHPGARARIDAAIQAAMDDAPLNAVLNQYFGNAAISTEMLGSVIFDTDTVSPPMHRGFDELDVRRVIRAQSHLAGLDLCCTAINIVLPQGVFLAVVGQDGRERPAGATCEPGVPLDEPIFNGAGLAGYHGSVQVDGFAHEVLYSVTVWSQGNTGIAVEGWQPWECMVATLYHELQEIRTNPDVDRAVRSGSAALIGWNTDMIHGPDDTADYREIGDLGLILHQDDPQMSFVKVPLAADPATIVPIQRMWSNLHKGLQPITALPPHPQS